MMATARWASASLRVITEVPEHQAQVLQDAADLGMIGPEGRLGDGESPLKVLACRRAVTDLAQHQREAGEGDADLGVGRSPPCLGVGESALEVLTGVVVETEISQHQAQTPQCAAHLASIRRIAHLMDPQRPLQVMPGRRDTR